MKDDERLLVALVQQPVLDVDRDEQPVPGWDLMTLAVQLGGERAPHTVDELLGIGVVVLADAIAGAKRRNAHESGRAADRLRAQ